LALCAVFSAYCCCDFWLCCCRFSGYCGYGNQQEQGIEHCSKHRRVAQAERCFDQARFSVTPMARARLGFFGA
jgi:hypothetical protein